MSIYSVNILSVCLLVMLQKALLLMYVFILVLLDDCNLVFCFRVKVVILFPQGITMKENGIRYLFLSLRLKLTSLKKASFSVFIMAHCCRTQHLTNSWHIQCTWSFRLFSYFQNCGVLWYWKWVTRLFVEKIGFDAYFWLSYDMYKFE